MNGAPLSLRARIAGLIAAEGPISLAHYMTLALHDPEEGYYARREPFGAQGDFITAPEISQMFGELLGLWCVEVWRGQGAPKRKRLVELGPGRGTLMADALRAMKAAPEFLEGLELVLVETSPTLRKIQAEKLEPCGVKPRWAAQFEEGDSPLFLLANEFFDALPVHQYVRTARGWCERLVAVEGGALAFSLAPAPALHVPQSRQDAPEGGVYETAPAAIALTETIARNVAQNGGGALIVDYGYGKPGFGETLQAVRGHGFANVLADPGKADLSAHVDFAAMSEAARAGGAEVYGPRGQGEFLTALGIAARAQELAKTNPGAAQSLGQALERLTAPAQMGTLFKAMAFLPPAAPPPPGF